MRIPFLCYVTLVLDLLTYKKPPQYITQSNTIQGNIPLPQRYTSVVNSRLSRFAASLKMHKWKKWKKTGGEKMGGKKNITCIPSSFPFLFRAEWHCCFPSQKTELVHLNQQWTTVSSIPSPYDLLGVVEASVCVRMSRPSRPSVRPSVRPSSSFLPSMTLRRRGKMSFMHFLCPANR